MILRLDRIAIDLPKPKQPSANDAAVVQELLGGKFGEMSTLMNYTYQSFNFRGRTKLRPFYDLIANIAAEEYGHIELVSYTINSLLTGVTKRDTNPANTPLLDSANFRNTYHTIASGQGALPMDSMGNFWTGANVYSSGNLKSDLLHNFFLEVGARGNKIRAYETSNDPCARAMLGYLLVRGGVHAYAYALALEKLTGVNVTKLLPIPDISNKKFPEAKKFEDEGLHTKLYQFTPDNTIYAQASKIWNGPHPEDGKPLVYEHLPAGYGVPAPDFDEEPQLSAPTDPDMFADILKRLG